MTKMVECDWCLEEFPEDRMLFIDNLNVTLCPECQEREVECKWCHEKAFVRCMHYDKDATPLCPECYKIAYECYYCGCFISEYEDHYSIEVGENAYAVCESCFAERCIICDGCGEGIIRGEEHEINDDVFCDKCYKRHLITLQGNDKEVC